MAAAETAGEGRSRHTLYRLAVEAEGGEAWHVTRRFSNFQVWSPSQFRYRIFVKSILEFFLACLYLPIKTQQIQIKPTITNERRAA